MKPKTVVTAVLLLFVAASVVYLVVNEMGNGSAAQQKAPQTPKLGNTTGDETAENKVVVYYFHGNFRCATCRTIEAYAKESVDTGFPKALEDGRLEWRVVNIEETDNEHFVKDFELSTRSVVLEEIANGKRKRWKNLDRVWELIRGDKDTFLKYIQDETKAFLETENQ